MPAEGETGQRAAAPKIFNPHIDHDGAVGIGAIPSQATHAVGHDAALHGTAPDHPAARAHAEGIYGAVHPFDFCGEEISRRREVGMTGPSSVLDPVDRLLRMFDA